MACNCRGSSLINLSPTFCGSEIDIAKVIRSAGVDGDGGHMPFEWLRYNCTGTILCRLQVGRINASDGFFCFVSFCADAAKRQVLSDMCLTTWNIHDISEV